MSPHLISALTDLADSALILPLCMILAVGLWLLESRRMAGHFLLALFACLATMALLKLGFLSCGRALGSAVMSPSGHMSLSTFFFGALAAIVFARLPSPWRWLAPLTALGLAITIGVTRVMLGAHNPVEVVIGGLAGLATLAIFVWPYLKNRHPGRSLRPLLIALLPVFLLCYGSRLPAEELLHRLIPHIQPGACVV